MDSKQVKAESDAVLAWIRARPDVHKELMGYAQVAKRARTKYMRDLAQKRFDEIYEQACKEVGIKV